MPQGTAHGRPHDRARLTPYPAHRAWRRIRRKPHGPFPAFDLSDERAHKVELENGRIKYEGDSKEFLAQPRFKTNDDEETIEDRVAAATKSPQKAKNRALELVTESTFVSEASSASEAESDSETEEDQEEAKEKPARKLIEDETRAVGRVGWSVWSLYLGLSGGTFFWISFALIFGGEKVADVAQTFWLNLWYVF